MAGTNQDFPYKTLGGRLRAMRERLRESLAEVAGSVEIEPDALVTIEEGKSRPSEDILLLLISHFAVKEDEAIALWELAGYERLDGFSQGNTNDDSAKGSVMMLPIDARIAYTDMAHVVVNDHGVVLNFMQTNGPSNQPMIVSRLGMSREHAQSIIELLQKTLSGAQQSPSPLALPAPELDSDPA